jgi:hypothetical protein
MILAILADFSKKLARNLVNSKKVPTFALLLRGKPHGASGDESVLEHCAGIT